MIIETLLDQVGLSGERGLVFAAGGSADIILAKTIAAGLVGAGCARVDIAQPLNCRRLSEKGLLAEAGRLHALEPDQGLDPEAVLRHHSVVPAERHPDHRRGKGLSISASLEWRGGERYVFAAHGSGPRLLASRRDAGSAYYDFVVGVDGGGDVLTHGDDEFDRVVSSGIRSGWTGAEPLVLVALGLGADGGSAPVEFEGVKLSGWRTLQSTMVDARFADALQADLERLGLWNSRPSTWSADDPYWGYGLKVPQIVAMAVRGDFPFESPEDRPDIVMFPRRGQLKVMDRRLLREARIFLAERER